MDQEDLIQQQMQATRDSLTEKLEILEHKVMDTVTGASSAVNQTVESIKESVQGTVASVNETVKESVDTVKDWVDVKSHVQHHPWMMLGGSLVVGFGLGALLHRSASSAAPREEPRPEPTYASPPLEERRSEEKARPAESLLTTFQPELTRLKSVALGALFGAAREALLKAIPEHLGQQVKEVVDRVTEKMGGAPSPPSERAREEPKDGSDGARRRAGGERPASPTQ